MVNRKKGCVPIFLFAALFLALSVLLVCNPVGTEAACMSCISRTGTGYTEVACEGDSRYDVIRKCGPPDYTEESQQVASGQFGRPKKEDKTQGFNVTTENIDTSYYNCGQGRFIKILIFRGGQLISIQNGDRGSGEQKCW